MNKLEDAIHKHIDANQDNIITYKAPDLADDIWQQYQQKKQKKHFAVAASVCLLALVLGWQKIPGGSPDFIAQSYMLEQRLAEVVDNPLSDDHRALMSNWHHELSMIDQSIEEQGPEFADANLWADRASLLTQMIEFYAKPVDFYEI